MTRGLNDHTPNGRDVYPDIIDHPHWQSPTRKHMSLQDRAAQFSPFDALTGYSDMVLEEQRLTEEKIQLSDAQLDLLDHNLNIVQSHIQSGTASTSVTYFEQDPFKDGGAYRTVTGTVRKIDQYRGVLVLRIPEDSEEIMIPISDILELEPQGSV